MVKNVGASFRGAGLRTTQPKRIDIFQPENKALYIVRNQQKLKEIIIEKSTVVTGKLKVSSANQKNSIQKNKKIKGATGSIIPLKTKRIKELMLEEKHYDKNNVEIDQNDSVQPAPKKHFDSIQRPVQLNEYSFKSLVLPVPLPFPEQNSHCILKPVQSHEYSFKSLGSQEQKASIQEQQTSHSSWNHYENVNSASPMFQNITLNHSVTTLNELASVYPNPFLGVGVEAKEGEFLKYPRILASQKTETEDNKFVEYPQILASHN